MNQDSGPCVLASFASDVSSCVAVLRLASAWPAAPQRREKTRILFDEANVQRKINKKNQPKKNTKHEHNMNLCSQKTGTGLHVHIVD